MPEKCEFQLNCVFIDRYGDQIVIDEDHLEVLMASRNYVDYEPVYLTRQNLRDNLGFTITDLGDYWQAEKGDFVLNQLKFQILNGIEMPFVFSFKTSSPKMRRFDYVHDLQNFYLQIQQESLEWMVKKNA